MSLIRSLTKRYFRLRLPKQRWHIISVLPQLKLKPVRKISKNVKDIVYRGKLIARTKPLTDLKKLLEDECFIVATGPSIKSLDLNQLKGRCLFGVNGATALTETHGLQFKFYAVIDDSFAKNKFSLVKSAIESGAHCLFSYRVIKAICDQDPNLLKQGNIYLLQDINGRYDGFRLSADKFYFHKKDHPYLVLHDTHHPEETNVGFSKNIELGAFDGGTVAFWACQVAYYIGFPNLFILGMDLGSSGKATRFYDNEKNALPCYLDDDYEKAIKPAFETFAHVLQDDSMKVFNLSLNSRLPDSIIPKLSFEEALNLN